MNKTLMSKPKLIVPAAMLLFVAALYGGYKGYIHYQVTSELDKLIALAAPYAHISYGGITSTLDGRLTVEKVRVIPQGVPDEANIEAIGILGDGPMFLLRLLSGAKDGDPPKKLNFFLRGFKLGLSGEFAAHYTSLLQGFRQETGGPTPDSCDFGGWVSPDALKAQGMDAVMLDMDVGYSFGQGGDLRSQLKFGVRGIETTRMDLSLAGMPQPGMMMTGAMPRLEDFAITYELDPGYAAAALGRCASARGQTLDAYVDALFENERQFAQSLGFIPGPGISQALKAFLKQPDRIVINTQLPADFDPTSLGLYAPKDWVRILGLELEVNGVAVTDLSFTLPAVSDAAGNSWLSMMTGARQSTADDGAVSGGADQKEAPRRVKREYVVMPVAQLREHVGKEVRLHTANTQTARVGELFSLDKTDATVVQHVHGGKMSVHVPLADIIRAEVLMVVE